MSKNQRIRISVISILLKVCEINEKRKKNSGIRKPELEKRNPESESKTEVYILHSAFLGSI